MKQNFKSLNNTLQNVIKKYNLDEAYANQILKNDWNKIVNKNICKIIKPVRLEGDILFIQAKTEHWKAEFKQIQNKFLKTINQKISPYKINEIKFI